MLSSKNLSGRLLLAGGFVMAVAAAPIASVVVYGSGSVLAVESCPEGEVIDPASGICGPSGDLTIPTFDPINPEGAVLQPGAITSSEAGEVGRLPEVDGIPCDGANTGQCIGLSENQPNFQKPESTFSSSP